MMTKEKALRAVESLPDDASLEDIVERLVFLSKVERGLQQADAGHTVAHSEIKERMSKWQK